MQLRTLVLGSSNAKSAAFGKVHEHDTPKERTTLSYAVLQNPKDVLKSLMNKDGCLCWGYYHDKAQLGVRCFPHCPVNHNKESIHCNQESNTQRMSNPQLHNMLIDKCYI
uniref:Uncharacterized protein n=1 Tax=Octopus bimaculoides TaxID=37653 RepID=A0A0L8G677_OCTBM